MNERRRAQYNDFERKRAEHARERQTLAEVNKSLDQQQASGGVTVLTGPTGIGKTHVKNRIRLAMIAAFKQGKNTNGHMPFLPVTALPPLHGRYQWPTLFRAILDEADEFLRNEPNSKPAHYTTSYAVQQAAMNVLRYRRPGVFCVDEAQHMTYGMKEDSLGAHFDIVKSIALEARRPVLLVGTYELLRFSRLSGQLGRRVNHVAYTPYDWASDADREDFKSVLRNFVELLPATVSLNQKDKDDLRFAFAGSVGCVGLLKEWLARALYEAFDDGRSRITRADLERARLPRGKLITIADEIERGRAELRAMDASDAELEKRLGMRPVDDDNNTPATRATPRLLPGRRKPVRDPVDEQPAA